MENQKTAFIICTVRGATQEYRDKLEAYVKNLEDKGYKVHLPHRDTNQEASGLEICTQNGRAIMDSDEVHIFYNGQSQGTHFDMGMTFMLSMLIGSDIGIPRPELVIAGNEEFGPGKSYARMLTEWVADQDSWKKLPPLGTSFIRKKDKPSGQSFSVLNDVVFDMLHSQLYITDEQVLEATRKAKEEDMPVMVALTELYNISDHELMMMVASIYGLETFDFTGFDVLPPTLEACPAEVARRYGVMPVSKIGNVLTIAVSDPSDLSMIDTLDHILGCDVEVVMSTARQISDAIKVHYPEDDVE